MIVRYQFAIEEFDPSENSDSFPALHAFSIYPSSKWNTVLPHASKYLNRNDAAIPLKLKRYLKCIGE